jgi:hypothetical protein
MSPNFKPFHKKELGEDVTINILFIAYFEPILDDQKRETGTKITFNHGQPDYIEVREGFKKMQEILIV